jgi:hypothetical protein
MAEARSESHEHEDKRAKRGAGEATAESATDWAADRMARGMDGVVGFEKQLMGLVRDTAADTIHVATDVVGEAVRGVGQVGTLTVRTASTLLVDVAQGLRDVAGTLVSLGRHHDQPRP